MTQTIKHTLSEEVLNKAMNIFWEKGLHNTSIDDLVSVTGLNRATLYKYFGDKDDLFLAMLERFYKNVTSKVILPLQNKTNAIEGIITFFTQFLDLYDSIGLRSRGCFLVATSVEIHSYNKKVNDFIKNYFNNLRQQFRDALDCAKREKLIKPEVDVESLADFLVGSFFGLMNLCRSDAPREVFENHISGVASFLSLLSTKKAHIHN